MSGGYNDAVWLKDAYFYFPSGCSVWGRKLIQGNELTNLATKREWKRNKQEGMMYSVIRQREMGRHSMP
jgi:hypothetical protein